MERNQCKRSELQVLLVEDSDAHAELARMALSQCGDMAVTHVDTLFRAIKEIDQHTFDVVLLDLNLPDTTGIDTVESVRHAAASTPIVVLTTHDDVGLSNLALGAGAQDYLPKSHLESQSLARSIRYAIERQHVVNENESLSSTLRRTIQDLEQAREAALSACQAKSDFLAGMSHEIRSPLTAVIGFADLALETVGVQNDPDALDAVRTVCSNGRHLLELINEVLDASKFEAGAMTLDVQAVSVHGIADDIVQLLTPKAKEKGLSLTLMSCGNNSQAIETDPVRLRQVIMNLVSNAVKFTDSGEVTVAVGVEQLSQARRLVRVEVSDTGIGMTPEQVEAASSGQAFWQADTSMTRRFGGTGLGLWLSHSITSMLGGALSIDSTYGKGTRCSLTLEAGVSPSAEAKTTPAGRAGSSSLQGVHVLVVDDSRDNRKLVASYMRRAGAVITEASTGRQAVSIVSAPSTLPIDVVLMDLHMPECDGAMATSLMKDAGYHGPVFVLTASTDPESRDVCERAGCSEFFTKPVDRDELVRAVNRHSREMRSGEQSRHATSPPQARAEAS